MEMIIFYLVSMVVAGIMAEKRNRSILVWVGLGLLISPLGSIILLLALGENKEK